VEIREEMGINANSPKQVKEFFDLKSSDRDELMYHIQRGDSRADQMRKILRYRDLTKGGSTFLKGVYKRREGEYIHTEYNLGGTATGRLSSSNPNLQNIQKPFRAIYEAEPGYVLVSVDAKQLELWVGALLAPCEVLLNDLRNKVDIHGQIQELIRPYLPERLKISERYMAKAVVFGTFYGRSARSIAIEYGVSIDMAKSWQEECIKKYPGLLNYLRDREKDARYQGYVETPFGRRRYISSPTQAYNTPIQSSASDVILYIMINLDKAGIDIRLNVHDEIVFQAPKDSYMEQIKIVKEIFERPVPQLRNNSFPCAFKVGENWYEMEDVDI